MTAPIVIDLPFPPSTNRLWRVVKHRSGASSVSLSNEYKLWKDQADRLFMTQIKPLRDAGAKWPIRKYLLGVTLERGHHTDSDNCIKAVNDWLQDAGIVENDRHCEGGQWGYGIAPHGARVTVRAVE